MSEVNYPTWRYHATLAPCVVDDADADARLGEGWADTPAAFSDQPEEPKKTNSKKAK